MSRDAAGARFVGIGGGIGQAPASAAVDAWGWDKIFRAAAATRDDNKPGAKAAGNSRLAAHSKPREVFAGIGRGFKAEPTAEATAADFAEALKAASPGYISKVK